MNFPVRIEPGTWELATGSTYMVSLDDFDGALVVTDAATGEQRATGQLAKGWPDRLTTLPLGVPLCGFCDAAVPDGYCGSCMTIHTDVVDAMNTEPLSELKPSKGEWL